MATKPKNNNNNIVVIDSGAPTGTGPSPLPMDGTTKNNDDKVTTTLVTTEPPILMLTGFDVAAIMWMMYIVNHSRPEAVLPRSVEGGGQYHSSSSSSSSTGNHDKQMTAMVTTGPQIMLTGLYMAALCKLETNEDGGSTTEKCTISLSTISINLFDFLTALLLLRPLYYFNPAIGIRIVSTRKEENSDKENNTNDEEQIIPARDSKTKKNNNNNNNSSNDNSTNAKTKTTTFHNGDEDGGALLFDDEYAEMESLAGQLGLSAGQLGLSNKERLPVTNVLDLPSSLLLDCFLYLDLISSMIVSTLNKQCRAVVRGPGMEALYRPVLHISTSGERENNHRRLLEQLSSNRNKLLHYRDATISNVNQFDNFDDWRDALFDQRYFFLRGLESLTISSTSPPLPRSDTIVRSGWFPLLRSLQFIMPNIQRINFTGANFGFVHLPPLLVWPRLTKITWNGIGISDSVDIRGFLMTLLKNLREMYMDDSFFYWDLSFPSDPDEFIFQKCCQNLERMSIRNARYYFRGPNNSRTSPVPQQELIKFVRNAPSLKWFRSDLTLDNIAMLQKERPGIELLS